MKRNNKAERLRSIRKEVNSKLDNCFEQMESIVANTDAHYIIEHSAELKDLVEQKRFLARVKWALTKCCKITK